MADQTLYTVLHFSTPASPRKDVKFGKTWRLAWVDVTLDRANQLVDSKGPWSRSYKVVPSDQVSNYL